MVPLSYRGVYCFRLFCAQCMSSSSRVWFSSLIIPHVWYLTTVCIHNSTVYTPSSIHYIRYILCSHFHNNSIVLKRLITPVIIIMLPPCSSSLVSSSHFYDETITSRHPRNDALALLSSPSVVLQKGGRGNNAVAKARCLSLVHASAKNRGQTRIQHPNHPKQY